MAYDPGALEATLAAAVGQDSALIDELRDAFFKAADGHVGAMRAARDAEAWVAATRRLENLGAGFGALRLIDAARAAGRSPIGDRGAMARIERALSGLAATS